MIGKRNLLLRFAFFLLLSVFANIASAKSDEELVGEVAAGRILGAAVLVDVPAAQRYINLVGALLTQRVDANYSWRFGLIKTESVNAFATPGGFVLITSGLVKQLQNEDELAFVLAHEIAHVIRRHHYKVVQRQRLAETAAKQMQASTADASFSELSQASAQIYARGLDKNSEFEADRLGTELMTQSGYDPASAIGVLERLQKLKGDDPRAELLFATHPSAAERMDTLLQTNVDSLPRPALDVVNQRAIRFKQFLSQF